MNETRSPPDFRATPTRVGGGINWLGVWTLYMKEVRRFLKVLPQTVLAPVVTTLLFMLVFKTALSGVPAGPHGVPFEAFLAPGLIMMQVIQNAFMNTSSSLLLAKVQGNVVDFLMPPLSAGELTFAFVMGGVTRGILVAIATMTGMMLLPFQTLGLAHPWAVVFYVLAGSMLLSSLGVVGGIWAEKFDQVAVLTNFVVMPLSFLSGTFYPVDRLTGIWHTLSHWNPFFFLIDGFRYGMTGLAPSLMERGLWLIVALNILLWALCHILLASGYRLKN